MKIFANYFFSRSFWRNIIYALGMFLVILIIFMSGIRVYTHHGKSAAVPDFSDMPLQEAIELIVDKNLRYEIFDSHYVADKVAGVIIDQHPLPDFLVKKNRKIFLTINASSPGKIEMPNLVGITLREARIRIEGYGLKLGKLFYKYDISENVILEQQLNGNKIESSDSIIVGSNIDLILGKGLANKRKIVPDLVGMTVKQAEIVATNATFNIGAVIEDNTISEAPDSLIPFIFKQKPESNPAIFRPLGSTISLFVTLDSAKVQAFKKQKESDYIWNDLNN